MVSASKQVTQASPVTLDRATTETHLGGVTVDVLAYVDGTPLGILFITPEHREGEHATFEHGPYGAISIDLTPLENIHRDSGNPTERLMAHITDATTSKRWLYHSREQAVRHELERELVEQCAQQKAEIQKKHERQNQLAQRKREKVNCTLRQEPRNFRKSPPVRDVTERPLRTRGSSEHATFQCSSCNGWFFITIQDQTRPCSRCGGVGTLERKY